MNEKQNRLVKKIARLDSNTKLPGYFIRKAVFPLGAVMHQHLTEGYGDGLKVEQGKYVLHHHRLESPMRIPSLLFDRHYVFPPAGD